MGYYLQTVVIKMLKVIKSPDDLQTFVNVFCEKHKSTDKMLFVCVQVSSVKT